RWQPPTPGNPVGTWLESGTCPVQLESPGTGKELGGAALLPSGSVFYIGGNNTTALYTPPANDVGTGTWVQGPNIPNDGSGNPQGEDDAPMCILPNGNVLVAVDTILETAPTVFYEYTPPNGNNGNGTFSAPISAPSDMRVANIPAFKTRMLMLPNGHVLFSDSTDQLWDYSPGGAPPDPSRP